MARNILLIIAILLFGASGIERCLAAEPGEMPSIELPANLKPYANAGKVTDAAEAVIKLLGIAKFDEPPADSVLSKDPCNTAEMGSFYRAGGRD